MKKNIWFIIASVVAVVVALLVITSLSNKGESGESGTKLQLDYSQISEETRKLLEEEATIVEVRELYEGQPFLGKVDAPVEIIVFGDYKCIHCFNYENQVFGELYEKYIKTGIVKYHYSNMQMLGSESIVAGVIGEEIFEQSPQDFWTYHMAIYDNFSVNFDNDRLLDLVEKNTKNVDLEKVKAVLENPEAKFGKVYQDYYKGIQAGVQGTPTVLIQGIKAGSDLESIEAIIEAIYDEEAKEVLSDEEIEGMMKQIQELQG